MKRSRMGRRRALVLGLVHVAIVLHVTHWLLRGRTVSPVEPSESMRTLELGELNAGFVFFVLAIVSTALFGRFFCGWGCHVVALQDLCAWLMKKAGVKPKPFRSRLLLWAPAALAFYMFAWPTVKRIFGPVLGAAQPPFPGFTNHLTTSSFWATFPGVAVAVPFLLVCGFAVVYLLGSKGFFTYGCPYGGIFAPLDRFARGRIRVSDACNGCGHCTATCTSNVRVHEEVRAFKMVVDPGCMKCMDCVSVCPNDALSYGFAGPGRAQALAAAPPGQARARRFDLAWSEEIAIALVFTGTLLAFRGVYDVVPLLMAVGLALCTTFLAWTSWRMLRDPSVSIQNAALKQSGRIRGAAFAWGAAAAALLALTAQSAAVQLARGRAEAWDRRVNVPGEQVFAGAFAALGTPAHAAARRAEALYRRADTIAHGGWGLLETPEVPVRRAWLALVTGDVATAEAQLRRILVSRPDEIGVRDGLARVLLLDGRADEAAHEWRRAIGLAPTNASFHEGLAEAHVRAGRLEDAIEELVIATNLDPANEASRAKLERVRVQLAREQAEAARRAAEPEHTHTHGETHR
jgi:ferredoxin-type protein NapH